MVDVSGLPLGVSPCCQQAHLRIAPRPEAQSVKPAGRLAVSLQPGKSYGLILEAPRFNQPQGLRQLGKRGPQKTALSGAVMSATGNLKHFPVKTFVVTPKEMLDIINENDR